MADAQSRSDFVTVGLVVLGLAVQSGVVWTAAYFYYNSTPQLAVFDSEKSVERFVVWSSDRVADDQFDDVLARFGQNVEKQLDIWSSSTGIAVVQQGSVISSGSTDLVDWTDLVVEEVLQ